ncbi:MAG: ROK family protein [Gemmatimonadota bacterium]
MERPGAAHPPPLPDAPRPPGLYIRAVSSDFEKGGPLAWGVDLGGTRCKVGVVDPAGAVLAERRIPTLREPEAAVTSIARACREVAEEAKVGIDRLGMGAPGPMRFEEGVIVHAPNLGWRDVPLRSMVAEAVGCPVVLENDANVAALGEAWMGAGRGSNVLLLVTLGTGVGGGVVEKGRIFHGARGLAVEVGHEVVVPGGRPCPCGKRGCVEAYFSGHALTEQATERFQGGDPTQHRAIFEAYAAGDPEVVPWMDEAIDALARGVALAGVLFDPDLIVFTGGLARSWEVFAERLVAGIEAEMGPAGPSADRIGLSALDGRAGVIGAARLAFDSGARR